MSHLLNTIALFAIILLAAATLAGADPAPASPQPVLPSTAAQSAAPAPAPILLPAPQLVGLSIDSPKDYQVFQRRTKYLGFIRVAGTVAPGQTVQMRITGTPIKGKLEGDWRKIAVDNAAHSFCEEIAAPAGGWYRIEFKTAGSAAAPESAAIEHVGVGEVFVGAGQSNSTSYGLIKTQPESGMVTTFNGSEWRIAYDPQPGSHDEGWWKAHGGSLWPAFGDAMYEHYHVPIGVAVTGNGGTFVENWLPETKSLFDFTMTRVAQLGYRGFRALLWHQGENDYSTPTDIYAARLAHIIATSHERAGWAFPWFVAQASIGHRDSPVSPLPRAGQKTMWDLGLAQPGPDTDTLRGDYREATGGHMAPKGLQAHGEMWAKCVEAYLDPLLAVEK